MVEQHRAAGDETRAADVERCILDLEHTICAWAFEKVTPKEAGRFKRLTASAIRRQLREDKLTNVGTDGRKLIYQGDLIGGPPWEGPVWEAHKREGPCPPLEPEHESTQRKTKDGEEMS